MSSKTIKHSGQLSSYRSSLASFSPSLNRFGGRCDENWSNSWFIDFISIRRIQPSSFFRGIILFHCRQIAFRWKIPAPWNPFRWKMPPTTPFRRINFSINHQRPVRECQMWSRKWDQLFFETLPTGKIPIPRKWTRAVLERAYQEIQSKLSWSKCKSGH